MTPTESTKAAAGIVPVVARTFTSMMEQSQEGYVSCVAATAGCSVELIRRDLYLLHAMIFRSIDESHQEVSVMAQLKNTTLVTPDPDKSYLRYQFRNPDHLRRRPGSISRLRRPRDDPGDRPPEIAALLFTQAQSAWPHRSLARLETPHSRWYHQPHTVPPVLAGRFAPLCPSVPNSGPLPLSRGCAGDTPMRLPCCSLSRLLTFVVCLTVRT